jgi:hypothetical protein
MIRPFGSFIYFRKTIRPNVVDGGKVLIHLPDDVREFTNLCELIAFGPKCRYIDGSMIGGFCNLPEMINGMHRLGSVTEDVDGVAVRNEDWAIREKVLMEHCPAVMME